MIRAVILAWLLLTGYAFAQVGQIPDFPTAFNPAVAYVGPLDSGGGGYSGGTVLFQYFYSFRCASASTNQVIADIVDLRVGPTKETRLQCTNNKGVLSYIQSGSCPDGGITCGTISNTCSVTCYVRRMYNQGTAGAADVNPISAGATEPVYQCRSGDGCNQSCGATGWGNYPCAYFPSAAYYLTNAAIPTNPSGVALLYAFLQPAGTASIVPISNTGAAGWNGPYLQLTEAAGPIYRPNGAEYVGGFFNKAQTTNSIASGATGEVGATILQLASNGFTSNTNGQIVTSGSGTTSAYASNAAINWGSGFNGSLSMNGYMGEAGISYGTNASSVTLGTGGLCPNASGSNGWNVSITCH
jgi:hypothetical protein